jgi:predicted dehydrogenase
MQRLLHKCDVAECACRSNLKLHTHVDKNSPDARQESRRDFMKKGALAATAIAAGLPGASTVFSRPIQGAPALGSVLGANDRISVAFIGVGGQGMYAHVGNVLNRTVQGRPMHDLTMNAVGVAAADVYDKRRDAALSELRLADPNAKAYADYREILDRSDIDAVFVGTVDHWHARISIDAMNAGKHVYCEKPMTRYLGEAFGIYDTAKATGRVFQIGSQYCADARWHKAAELIRQGKLGKLVLGQADYCRNNPEGEWNYTIDPDAGPDRINWRDWLGPVSDRPFSADHYYRWRKYYPYCSGILGDLLAHRIHPLLIATSNPEFPTRVACLGTREVTPDRDSPDNTQLIANFPSGLSFLVIGSTVNEQGLGQVIRGNMATLYMGGNSVELRPERPFADLADREEHTNLSPGPSVPVHILDFFNAIRNGGQPKGNIDLAIRAQTILSLAEMSERMGEMMHFDEQTRRITNGRGEVIEPITYGTLPPA